MTGRTRKGNWRYWFAAQRGALVAMVIFAVMFGVYGAAQSIGLTSDIVNTAANKGALLALVAMAQTLPVLTGGLDLSVGMIFMLANCLASTIVVGSPAMTALGIVGVLAAGLVCGLVNGLIVVYGRLQPLIATLATSAIYFGVALALRPQPGGDINGDFADLMTRSTFGVPSSLLLIIAAIVFVWLPYRNSMLGRAAYAVGSSEQAAYMSGVPIARVKLSAYTLAGFFAALGGLLLTCITFSGEARAALGGDYTLNSIAALVIGGTSLFGGSGGVVGSVFGAFVMRTVGDLLVVFNINPVLQPLFVGVVLLFAVSLGSLRLLRVRNKLDLFR
ncbi:ABC transporter permease [Paraburkholderia rhizosphaerae]|uniref:Autoinducer 2 import system permease protein LsrC n=1 Tax=Paraburkholderia rhizosphaerae TaxID=480658 RepID=A0A4R8M2Y0_9BURK|nr:ABC transporter permease [Paraburkholderia rhizosphaerae]TDY54135.1 monosaccharide ABC transporter membrane protein (CUT2 family) [Paraburkholderia rhizosphaerae]